jgi:Ala-tRNA(Pro) deacylase
MKLQEYLVSKSVAFEVELHPDALDAQHLAHALHVTGRHVAKAVLLHADHGFIDVVAVLPATHKIDLSRLSAVLGGADVVLASEAEIAQRCPDCEGGVVPPFGSIYGMKTILDASLQDASEIHFAGSNRHVAIRLAMHDYLALEHPLVATFASPARGDAPA